MEINSMWNQEREELSISVHVKREELMSTRLASTIIKTFIDKVSHVMVEEFKEDIFKEVLENLNSKEIMDMFVDKFVEKITRKNESIS